MGSNPATSKGISFTGRMDFHIKLEITYSNGVKDENKNNDSCISMGKRGKGGIKVLKSCWRSQRFSYSYHMFLLKNIQTLLDFLSHTDVAWVRGEMEKAENSDYKVFVCFIHTVFTLSRVWQNKIPVRLRASRSRWQRNHKVLSDGGGWLKVDGVFWQGVFFGRRELASLLLCCGEEMC